MAFASFLERERLLSPVAAAVRGEHPDRAGPFNDRLETRGKSADLGFIGIEGRAAVRNDDQLHVRSPGSRIDAIIQVAGDDGMGGARAGWLLQFQWDLAQVSIKRRLICRFRLLSGV
ncbi:hypothetical protein MTX20_37450 [Bradyrhizobium sp. ISRA435]|nr:hypothetical protein MTX20_37450 [Bradyrhizobium sp. ISRA435]